MMQRPLPLVLAIAATLAGSAPAAPGTAHRESPREIRPAHDKIHTQLRRLVDERGPSKAWVFFADKGLRDAAAVRDALAVAEARLHPRTRARRELRRSRPGLVDLGDVPVAPRYVAGVRATGAEVVTETSWLNAVSVLTSAEELERLAALPYVDRLEPVRRGAVIDGLDRERANSGDMKGGAGNDGPVTFWGASLPQLDQIRITSLHGRGYTGSGIVIGVLDTGFHRGHEAFNHPGHSVGVVAEWDFVDNDPNTGIEPGDDSSQHAHGTYILGTLGAYLPGKLVGAAYDATFILCKTEDVTNEYSQEEDFYVSGLQFIEANGGDIATSSLGYIDWYSQSDLDGLTATTTLGVNAATANGLVCLTAAGNYGHDSDPATSTLIAPSDAFDVITVGAADSAGVIASFSSDGPTADGRVKPELLARGVETWTVCAFTDSDCLTGVNGTSLSTPVLAGAVACMLDAAPTLSIADLRLALFETGDEFEANGTPDPLFVRGYGLPDVDRATFGGPRLRPRTTPPKPVTR